MPEVTIKAPKEKVLPALRNYRISAYVTGVFLLLLTALVIYQYIVLKFIDPTLPQPAFLNVIPIIHGWLYVIYLMVTGYLATLVRWDLKKLLITLIAGTIPFMSFVAEHYRNKEILEAIELNKIK